MWVQRGRKRYFYKSNGKSRKKYVGTEKSQAAQAAYAEDQLRALQKQQEQKLRMQREQIHEDIISAHNAVDLILDSLMLTSNFRFRRGEWKEIS